MKHLLDKAYARQREYSWRVNAARFEAVGWLAILILLCALTLLRALWGE